MEERIKHRRILNKISQVEFDISRTGKIDSLKDFIEVEGGDINTRVLGNETFLHLAAFGGRNEIIRYLLTKGADVNAKDYYGETPLHKAAHGMGNAETIRLLLNAGASTKEKDKLNRTPFNPLEPQDKPWYEHEKTVGRAKNIRGFKTALDNETSRISTLPSGIQSHIGSYLSGVEGSLNEQTNAMRRAGIPNNLLTLPTAPIAPAPACGGAGCAAPLNKSRRRRHRRATRHRR